MTRLGTPLEYVPRLSSADHMASPAASQAEVPAAPEEGARHPGEAIKVGASLSEEDSLEDIARGSTPADLELDMTWATHFVENSEPPASFLDDEATEADLDALELGEEESAYRPEELVFFLGYALALILAPISLVTVLLSGGSLGVAVVATATVGIGVFALCIGVTVLTAATGREPRPEPRFQPQY